MGRSSPRLRAVLLLFIGAFMVNCSSSFAQDGLRPGEAFVTRFSGATDEGGKPAIDLNGTVGSILDIRNPGSRRKASIG